MTKIKKHTLKTKNKLTQSLEANLLTSFLTLTSTTGRSTESNSCTCWSTLIVNSFSDISLNRKGFIINFTTVTIDSICVSVLTTFVSILTLLPEIAPFPLTSGHYHEVSPNLGALIRTFILFIMLKTPF